MKAELDIQMELEGAKQQLEIQEEKYSKQHFMNTKCGERDKLIAYINKLRGRVWALKFVLDKLDN